jgi:UDP-N-acetylmuramoyl-tripeptide--D-alanyl-D-alanine ligase
MSGAPIIVTAAMIATATGGQLTSGAPDQSVGGFAIDSRTLRPGELFFAIVAQRDGHAFIDDALARGAVGAVIRSGATAALRAEQGARAAGDGHPAPILIEVPDTTAALQDLARAVRRQSAAIVVAITGSAGKTTTKETIAALLAGHRHLIRNQGNLNNHLGLPLSLLELRHGAEVAVMELGMNHAGEIRVLVGIAEPQIRVWTNVGDAHLGHFASEEEIADAKSEILDQAAGTDVLVCNADDPRIMARAGRFPGRVVTFGTSSAADVRAQAIDDLGLDGTRFAMTTSAGSVALQVPLLGRGNVSNVLAAAAVAMEFGVPLIDIPGRCSALRPTKHRGVVLRLPSGVTLLDDSYNSSPAALMGVLDVIDRESRAARKIAVLGEMLELGGHSVRLHQECGRAAAAARLDRLITVGGDAARALAAAAIRAGMDEQRVTWTASSEAAADLLLPSLAAGDLVLVKGSRGIGTDIIVDRATAEYS